MDGGKRKKQFKPTKKALLALLKKKQAKKKGKAKTSISQVVNVNIGKSAVAKAVKAKGASKGSARGRAGRAPRSRGTAPPQIIEKIIDRSSPMAEKLAMAVDKLLVAVLPHPGRPLEEKDVIKPWRPEIDIPDASRIVALTGDGTKYDLGSKGAVVKKLEAAGDAVKGAKKEAKEAKKASAKEREEKHAAVADTAMAQAGLAAAKRERDNERKKSQIERSERANRRADEQRRAHRGDELKKMSKEEIIKLAPKRGVKPRIGKSLRLKEDIIEDILDAEAKSGQLYHVDADEPPSPRQSQEELAKILGEGRTPSVKRPLSNEEIDKLMSQVPGYQGAVPSDSSFEVKGTPPEKGVSWVMNLDKSGLPGSHWVAALITPQSVEYSDSFGDDPTPAVQERLVAAGKRLWPENRKTLKVNRVKRQDERTVDCGFHAMKFIRDRLSGKSFVQATGYDADGGQVRKSEEEVKEFAKRYPKFVQVGNGILDHPGDNMPYQVKAMLEKYGKEPVTSLEVVRAPVHTLISKILNAVTFGSFKEAMRRYNYDQLFHLALNVNGRYKLEKNATVQFSGGTLGGGEKKRAPVQPGTKVEDLFKRGGSAGFWMYDPRSNNCQDFIITVLGGVGSLTPELRTFIKQDVEGIFRSTPAYAGKIARFVTDIGGRLEGAKDKAKHAQSRVSSFLAKAWNKLRGRGKRQKGGYGAAPTLSGEELRRYNENLAKNYTAEGQYKDLGKGDINRFLVNGQKPSNYGEKTHQGPSSSFGGKIGDFLARMWKKLKGGRRRQRGGMNFTKPMPSPGKVGAKTYGATVDLGPRFSTQPRARPPVTVI